jgi:hypothetical protein
MPWSFVTGTIGESTLSVTDSATTPPTDFTVGLGADTLFLIVVNWAFVATTPFIQSTPTNTWQLEDTIFFSGKSVIRFYSCKDAMVSSTMTVTASTVGEDSYFGMILLGFNNGPVGVPFPAGEQDNFDGPVTSIVAGSSALLPSEDNCVVFAILGGSYPDNPPSVSGGGFPAMSGVAYEAGANFAAFVSYIIQTTATSVNPTFTFGLSDVTSMLIAFAPGTSSVNLKPANFTFLRYSR